MNSTCNLPELRKKQSLQAIRFAHSQNFFVSSVEANLMTLGELEHQELEKDCRKMLVGIVNLYRNMHFQLPVKVITDKAGLGKQLNHKTRMRSNCIEICNKLLRSLSSYDDLFREWNDRSARKARNAAWWCIVAHHGAMYHYVIKDAEFRKTANNKKYSGKSK